MDKNTESYQAYQVLNEFGYPAGYSELDLAIFDSRDAAKRWVKHLKEECDGEKYTVRPVHVSFDRGGLND